MKQLEKDPQSLGRAARRQDTVLLDSMPPKVDETALILKQEPPSIPDEDLGGEYDDDWMGKIRGIKRIQQQLNHQTSLSYLSLPQNVQNHRRPLTVLPMLNEHPRLMPLLVGLVTSSDIDLGGPMLPLLTRKKLLLLLRDLVPAPSVLLFIVIPIKHLS